MNTQSLTFRKMIVRDLKGNIMREDIVAVDESVLQKDFEGSAIPYLCVGAVDYSDNPEGTFRPYTASERRSKDVGGSMQYFDESNRHLAPDIYFDDLSCDDLLKAKDAFESAYPNIKIPTNTSQMQKLVSEAAMASLDAEMRFVNDSPESIAERYDNLKLQCEATGLTQYENVAEHEIKNYKTLSAFDKAIANAACRERAYAEDIAIVSAADRYGLVKAPKVVDGFELTPHDRASLDGCGVSLKHNIGHEDIGKDNKSFYVTTDGNGDYKAKVAGVNRLTENDVQDGYPKPYWAGKVFANNMTNNILMTAVKAKTAANIQKHNLSMTFSQIKDVCKTGWKNYCENAKRNYDAVKSGMINTGLFVGGMAVMGAKAVGSATVNMANKAQATVVNTANKVQTTVVNTANKVQNAVVDTKNKVQNKTIAIANGIKNAVVRRYGLFKNSIVDTYNTMNNGINKGIVDISDAIIQRAQNSKNNAERRIKGSTRPNINVNTVVQHAESVQTAAEQTERVAE